MLGDSKCVAQEADLLLGRVRIEPSILPPSDIQAAAGQTRDDVSREVIKRDPSQIVAGALKAWVLELRGDKIGELVLLVMVEQVCPEDGNDCDATVGGGFIVESVNLFDDVGERYAQDHAMDGPKAGVGRVVRPLRHANIEEASASTKLVEDGEILCEGKIGLDRGACATDGTQT